MDNVTCAQGQCPELTSLGPLGDTREETVRPPVPGQRMMLFLFSYQQLEPRKCKKDKSHARQGNRTLPQQPWPMSVGLSQRRPGQIGDRSEVRRGGEAGKEGKSQASNRVEVRGEGLSRQVERAWGKIRFKGRRILKPRGKCRQRQKMEGKC